jgi:hypothetical protein
MPFETRWQNGAVRRTARSLPHRFRGPSGLRRTENRELFLLWEKRAKCEANHSLPSSFEAYNGWMYTTVPLCVFLAWCWGEEHLYFSLKLRFAETAQAVRPAKEHVICYADRISSTWTRLIYCFHYCFFLFSTALQQPVRQTNRLQLKSSTRVYYISVLVVCVVFGSERQEIESSYKLL